MGKKRTGTGENMTEWERREKGQERIWQNVKEEKRDRREYDRIGKKIKETGENITK